MNHTNARLAYASMLCMVVAACGGGSNGGGGGSESKKGIDVSAITRADGEVSAQNLSGGVPQGDESITFEGQFKRKLTDADAIFNDIALTEITQGVEVTITSSGSDPIVFSNAHYFDGSYENYGVKKGNGIECTQNQTGTLPKRVEVGDSSLMLVAECTNGTTVERRYVAHGFEPDGSVARSADVFSDDAIVLSVDHTTKDRIGNITGRLTHSWSFNEHGEPQSIVVTIQGPETSNELWFLSGEMD